MGELGALVFVNVVEGTSPVTIGKEIADKPGVEEVMLISGQWDIMVKFSYDKMQELSDFIVSNLRAIKGVGKTDTTIILEQLKK